VVDQTATLSLPTFALISSLHDLLFFIIEEPAQRAIPSEALAQILSSGALGALSCVGMVFGATFGANPDLGRDRYVSIVFTILKMFCYVVDC